MPTARTSVFISYSHADSQWLRLLDTHLKPLTRDQKVAVWSDRAIRKGERWRDRIRRQLAQARVGIFLVSADFLASDFIHAEELPPLLKAADHEGATLLTIIVRPCGGAFQDSPLSQLQAMNGPHAPLSGMTKTQREQVMVEVYNELRSLFKAPTPSSKASAKKPAASTTTKTPTKRKITATKPAASAKPPVRPKRLPTVAKTDTVKKAASQPRAKPPAAAKATPAKSKPAPTPAKKTAKKPTTTRAKKSPTS